MNKKSFNGYTIIFKRKYFVYKYQKKKPTYGCGFFGPEKVIIPGRISKLEMLKIYRLFKQPKVSREFKRMIRKHRMYIVRKRKFPIPFSTPPVDPMTAAQRLLSSAADATAILFGSVTAVKITQSIKKDVAV